MLIFQQQPVNGIAERVAQVHLNDAAAAARNNTGIPAATLNTIDNQPAAAPVPVHFGFHLQPPMLPPPGAQFRGFRDNPAVPTPPRNASPAPPRLLTPGSRPPVPAPKTCYRCSSTEHLINACPYQVVHRPGKQNVKPSQGRNQCREFTQPYFKRGGRGGCGGQGGPVVVPQALRLSTTFILDDCFAVCTLLVHC